MKHILTVVMLITTSSTHAGALASGSINRYFDESGGKSFRELAEVVADGSASVGNGSVLALANGTTGVLKAQVISGIGDTTKSPVWFTAGLAEAALSGRFGIRTKPGEPDSEPFVSLQWEFSGTVTQPEIDGDHQTSLEGFVDINLISFSSEITSKRTTASFFRTCTKFGCQASTKEGTSQLKPDGKFVFTGINAFANSKFYEVSISARVVARAAHGAVSDAGNTAYFWLNIPDSYEVIWQGGFLSQAVDPNLSPVPEASTWLMFLFGLTPVVLLNASRNRRRIESQPNELHVFRNQYRSRHARKHFRTVD